LDIPNIGYLIELYVHCRFFKYTSFDFEDPAGSAMFGPFDDVKIPVELRRVRRENLLRPDFPLEESFFLVIAAIKS